MKIKIASIAALILAFTPQTAFTLPIATTGLPMPVVIKSIPMATPLPASPFDTMPELDPVYVPAPVTTPVTDPGLGCGDNSYANYIYMHESGCNPSSVNSIGCRGIGQACPGDKLPCGADYACQNAWFTAYAESAYGGWYGAYQHWLAYSWW